MTTVKHKQTEHHRISHLVRLWVNMALSGLDLGLGHTAYCHASLIDLYLHTKFHWNRKKFLWTDGHMYGRTYWRTFQTPSNVIRSTPPSPPNNTGTLFMLLPSIQSQWESSPDEFKTDEAAKTFCFLKQCCRVPYTHTHHCWIWQRVLLTTYTHFTAQRGQKAE